MTVHSLYILNKAGGLIYQRDFSNHINRLSSNDYLVLAGTFHSVHAITTRISPVPGSSGITTMETDNFALHCSQTLTGIKFLVISDLRQPMIDAILKMCYQLFADYVMKNPFYQIDMPVRCELFDINLAQYLQTIA
ncbi:Sybindin-like protein [Nadsonia fulvescens var. elongata DSM 6958]|uniref:Trafficking protein particle complex subunit n=1 Tax=Nadsonia fulvescens var. elongata DSM 6958 TaxID=857566 RepID=A0A1E3PQ89_9ASCO|nr:Sybindin-like protein [Nadsonia fulvescens var. elongata DSM 6958]